MAFYEGDTFLTESSFRNLSYMQNTKTGKNYMLEQMFLDVDEYVYGLGERFTPFVKNGPDGGDVERGRRNCQRDRL